jgi:UPF0755 protein
LNKRTLGVLGVLAVLLIAGVLWRRAQVHRWKWEPIALPERFARVPFDWSAHTLAMRMQENKKIRDAATFEEAAAEVGLKTVRAGGYLLPAKAGPLDLAKLFARGPSHLKVTFPEGFTVRQISARLHQNGFSAASQLRARAYLPGQSTSPLEGTLFPDTYWLPLKASEPQLVRPMQERYQEIAQKLPRPFPTGYQGKRLTLSEVTTLASLVERETDVPSERALVAGVLLKRLRDHMRLQCDASVQYALQLAANERGDFSHQIVLRKDYKFASPYNTYRNYGLPPAPICNPGKEALLAAARPQTTDYVFYVWSPKLKRHRFARTFEEHRHNIALAKSETTS